MKILMLGWELPPNNSGGLGVACYQLCKALASRGADIEFILPYSTNEQYPFMKVTHALPLHVEQVHKAGIAYDSYKYVYKDGRIEWLDIHGQQHGYEHAVANLASVSQFDVIHAHDWLTFRAALRLKEQTGKPFIAHVHSIERDRAGGHYGNPVVREIEYMALLVADRIIAVSEHTKKMIIADYHIPAHKISVIHNSIDTEDVAPLDDHNAYHYLTEMKARDWKVVATISRLTIQKGLMNFLRAAQLVSQKAPKTMFLIVGGGEQYHELIEESAALGIADKVVLTGFQRGKNWRDAYAIADLFVMPSISEPFGLTPLEAVGYGTPALISRQSGVAEVLSNCLKVNYWDIDGMANQIAAVVNNPALATELLSNARREYSRLSWDDAATSLMSVYHRHRAGVAV